MSETPGPMLKRIRELEQQVASLAAELRKYKELFGLRIDAHLKAADEANNLRADRDRLLAVVERLPKTKDGVVVVPGDEVFHAEWTEPRRIYVQRTSQDDNDWFPTIWREAGNDGDPPEYVGESWYQENDTGYYAAFCKPVSECFSTLEAALRREGS